MKQTKEHFFISRTGSLFSVYKLSDAWYIMGLKSKGIIPMMSSMDFNAIMSYAKNDLGLIKL